MKIKFLGAAKCVTGSSHLLIIDDLKILLDCGLFQGKDEKENNNEEFEFNPKEIDYVILSHAHVDHSGRIPLLFKKGFLGKIICTHATKDLCEYILTDLAHSSMEEVYFKNLKRRERGEEPLNSIYEEVHVKNAILNFFSCNYNEEIKLTEKVKVILKDAGHVLGSAICEILVKNIEKKWINIVYTGDLGNIDRFILKDPVQVLKGEIVIMEGTYGDKIHRENEKVGELLNIIKNTIKKGGNVVVPSFSFGRTQEIIYMLNSLIESGKLHGCKVYVDSPLASKLTKSFKKYEDYFDDEARELIEKGDNPLEFKGLELISTAKDSKNLAQVKSGAIIIASSGMCEGGRIMYHLKENLSRCESTVVFTCHQSIGTLGQDILSGRKTVNVLGEEVQVNCNISILGGLSGHADKTLLEKWIKGFKIPPKEVFLVHGESDVLKSFSNEMTKLGYIMRIPSIGEEFQLDNY